MRAELNGERKQPPSRLFKSLEVELNVKESDRSTPKLPEIKESLSSSGKCFKISRLFFTTLDNVI